MDISLMTALPELHLAPTAYLCPVMRVKPEWIDYNGHLNMAYYNVLFDQSLDRFFDMLGIGAAYLRERNKSTMTAECHVRYLREIHAGDPVQVHMLLLAADDKRLHTFEELRHAEQGFVSATSENMTLHIDMAVRRVAPFPPDIAGRIAAVAAAQASAPRPEGIGRSIGMPKR
jgi:acyl-CoA thioester hydrolase